MFKQYIESIHNEEGKALDNEIVQFILLSFTIRTQTHIYHLLTKSYAEHLAIGDFYEGLEDCLDSIAESAIGMGIDSGLKDYNSNLSFTYDQGTLISLVDGYRSAITAMITKTNSNNLMSINDKLINIQQLIDNLNYKLQLK